MNIIDCQLKISFNNNEDLFKNEIKVEEKQKSDLGNHEPAIHEFVILVLHHICKQS